MTSSTPTPAANPHQNPYLTEPDRPFYGFCRLMRQLPDDITNARVLTRDEALMAHAVAVYADDIAKTIAQGVLEIGTFMQTAQPGFAASMPHFAKLLHHLGVQSHFVREAAADYWDAAVQPTAAASPATALADDQSGP
jgi:hypothetical protein